MVTVAAFLESLRSLPILARSQLEEATNQIARRCKDGNALGQELVQRGWLTPYQASILAQGLGARLIFASYLVLEQIGEGAMGRVYMVRHLNTGAILALKLINQDRLGNPVAIERFRREAHVASQLNHINVVRAFEVGQHGGMHYYVMEYINGPDLSSLVKRHGPMRVEDACEYIRQAALGLQHAFERGVIHRDLKPANLLLSVRKPGTQILADNSSKTRLDRAVLTDTTLKILDFGLARFATEGGALQLTQAGRIVGTVDYVSPEQAQSSRAADTRSDIFSLGCTLFYLLTGKAPYPGKDLMERISARITGEPMSLLLLRPDSPPALEAVIKKMLANKPENRYQKPEQVAQALEAFSPVGWVKRGPQSIPAAIPQPHLKPGQGPSPVAPVIAKPSAVPMPVPHPKPGSPSMPMAQPARETVNGASPLPVPTAAAEQLRPPSRLRAPAVPAFYRKTPFLIMAGVLGSLLLIILVVTLTLVMRSGPASDHPSAVLEVEARLPWQDTHIDLEEDTELKLKAYPKSLWGARGEDQLPRFRTLNPEATTRCLLFRVGDDETLVPWGSPTSAFKGKTGRLFVRANDLDYERLDGRIELQIYGGSYNPDPAASPKPTRVEEFDAEFRKLRTSIYAPNANPREAVPRLKAFIAKHEELPQVAVAKQLLDGVEKNMTAGRGHRALRAHQDYIRAVAFTSNGQYVATASRDQTVTVWNTANGQPIRSYRTGSDPSSIAFSPDGKRLLVAGGKPEVSLFDTNTGKEVFQLKGHTAAITQAAFSPDGKLIVTGGEDKEVQLWHAGSGRPLIAITGHAKPVTQVAFDPEGLRLAVASLDGMIRIYDAGMGTIDHEMKGCPEGMTCLAFTKDGAKVVAGGRDGVVRIYDAMEGNELKAMKSLERPIACLALSADGLEVAVGLKANAVVHILELAGDKILAEYEGHRFSTLGLAYQPEQNKLASGGADGVLILWDRDLDK